MKENIERKYRTRLDEALAQIRPAVLGALAKSLEVMAKGMELLAKVLTELLAELLAELLTVAGIAGVCAPQAGTTLTLTKVIAKRMGVKRNSE